MPSEFGVSEGVSYSQVYSCTLIRSGAVSPLSHPIRITLTEKHFTGPQLTSSGAGAWDEGGPAPTPSGRGKMGVANARWRKGMTSRPSCFLGNPAASLSLKYGNCIRLPDVTPEGDGGWGVGAKLRRPHRTIPGTPCNRNTDTTTIYTTTLLVQCATQTCLRAL